MRPALALDDEIADADPAAARRLFELLAKPFAGYRFEHQRTLLRLMVAESLGQERVLEALAALEPNPPWMEELLKLRAETYAAAKHPLAEQAQRDWEYYQRHAK